MSDTDHPKVWRWPGDTPEDRAKRVAVSYRRLAEQAAPEACAVLDQQWLGQGVAWMVPSTAEIDLDAWLNAADMVHHLAPLVQLNEQQIRQMAYRKRRGGDGIIEELGPDGRPRYNVADLLAYQARARQRRAERQAR